MLAIVGLSITAAMSQSTYTITKVGTNFNTYKNGGPLTTNEPVLQNIIDLIKVNAGGADCIIQFGAGGSDVLDLGGGSAPLITFDGTAWGKITLTGKATTASTSMTCAILIDNSAISIECKAELTSTATTGGLLANRYGTLTISGGTIAAPNCITTVLNYIGGILTISGGTISSSNNAVENGTGGTLTISGGTILTTTGIAVYNIGSGSVVISGGTVQATGTTGRAVVNSNGEITVSGTALVTSANTSATNGTIYNNSATAIKITGGTVENTADGGNAVLGIIDISGGTVSATTGAAVRNNSTGTVNISGGTVLSTGKFGSAVYNNSTGTVDISGGTVQATGEWGYGVTNKKGTVIVSNGTISTVEGTGVHNENGTVTISGGTISSTAERVGVYNETGTVTVTGGTISAPEGVPLFNSNGTMNISGGTVSTTTGYAAVSSENAPVTISGGMILATTGYAIHCYDEATVSGGILFAYGGWFGSVISHGIVQPASSNAIIVAWDNEAGTTTYEAGTSDDIYIISDETTAVWAKQGSNSGISVANGTNIGFIPIADVTIGTTGIDDIAAEKIKMYPNPACNVLNFSIETPFEITDLQGRTVQKSDSAVKSVNISSLPSGTYFVTVTVETDKVVRKVVKE